MQSLQTPLKHKITLLFLFHSKAESLYTLSSPHLHSYLWFSPQVDDAVQLNVLPKLLMQPAVPVLIDRPLCFIHTLTLIEVRGKDVPAAHQSK